MWQIPRLALALQCSIPPPTRRASPKDLMTTLNLIFAQAFRRGLAHAVLNEVVYHRKQRTKTPNCSRNVHAADRVLAHTANEQARRRRADDARGVDARATVFARLRGRRLCVRSERDLEHTPRRRRRQAHALDATEREKRIGDIATELFELRKAREESPSPEAEVKSAEFGGALREPREDGD